MAQTPSTMADLDTPAPHFNLPEPATGETVAMADFAGAPALVVMFICNHCPFVKHIREELVRFGKDAQDLGAAVVAISSNDAEKYPDDNAVAIAKEVEEVGYTFPYLFDETQEIAKAYRAACTPDFFVYDAQRLLKYRGQFDAARPGNDEPITGADLRTALEHVLKGQPVPEPHTPSIGCNIKWIPGNEPDYA
jgi:peroxiredoxin